MQNYVSFSPVDTNMRFVTYCYVSNGRDSFLSETVHNVWAFI